MDVSLENQSSLQPLASDRPLTLSLSPEAGARGQDWTTRRQFLAAAGWSLLTPFVVRGDRLRSTRTASAKAARSTADVFSLSVASGDPSPTGVVLWTRIAPAHYSPQESLTFEVANDVQFQKLVLTADVAPEDFGPDRDHTVHLDLDGWLQSGRTYYYRFSYRQVVSRIGRCRTLPRPDARPASLRLGVVTCQDYTNGYYGAFAHLALEDVDFIVHLGDQIYESVGDPAFQFLPYPDRQVVLPRGQSAAIDLADFRHLYRQYRSDPLFQQCLENHTLIAIWDDHETANDCYWDYDRNTLGAPSHPITTQHPDGGDPAALRQLKLDAQRAWAEFIPARVTFDPAASHPFAALSIYRSFQFGQLAELFCTDERTYRSPHPCGEDQRTLTFGCDQQTDPEQSMLGPTQRDWFTAGVTGSAALWKVWANEVFLGPLKLGPNENRQLFLNLDAWDGYSGERSAILQQFAEHGMRNLVALTGDLHCYMAAYLKTDYNRRSNLPGRNLVGVEFMTPAVTSSTLIDFLLAALEPADRVALQTAEARQPSRFYFENLAKATNPHIHFFNGQAWGYSIVEFTPRDCTYSAYSVDTSVNSATAAKRLIRQIRVPVNQVRMIDIV
jgi:alkaline phosphatase D